MWAVGDRSPKTGRRRRLPFDAVWETRRLIVEVDEEQHRERTPFFDKPGRMTERGVGRVEQRKLYYDRKRAAARKNGYAVIVIPWSRKQERRSADLGKLAELLEAEGVEL